MGFDPKQKYRMIWYTNKNILVFAYKKLKWWEIIIENKQFSNIINMLKHINILELLHFLLGRRLDRSEKNDKECFNSQI